MRNERALHNIILKLFLGRCVRGFSEGYLKGVSGRNLKANLERQVQSFAMDLFLLELLRSLCGMLSRRACGGGGE
ncbi:hypothetical protein [Enterococcus phage vB_EfaS_Ef7.1]|nr:hypothetical protein [Enterococcus phage vB_EfaS_Ef7.1]